MTRIYLVRHAESNTNISGIKFIDSPLSSHGRKQLERISHRFQDISVHHIYSSRLIRAVETAQAIGAVVQIEVSITDFLHERVRPSHTNGLSDEDVILHDYNVRFHESSIDSKADFKDGENFQQFLDRVDRCFAFLHTIQEDSVLVSHGGFLRALIYRIVFGKRCTIDEWKAMLKNVNLSNTGISLLELKNAISISVLTVNDLSHL